MVPRVQIVAGAQAVVLVKMHFLVDTGVTQKVKEHLLGHAQRAEVFHFYQGGRSKVRGQCSSGLDM